MRQTNFTNLLAGAALAALAAGCDLADEPDDDALVEFRCAATAVPGIGGLQAATINGAAIVDGRNGKFDVFSNGAVQVAGDASVTGDLYSAAGDVRIYDDATVLGVTDGEGLEVSDWLPQSDIDKVWSRRRNNRLSKTKLGRDPTTNSDLDFTMYGGDSITASSGSYYFRSLSLAGGAKLTVSGTATIVIDGPLTVSGGSKIIADEAKVLVIAIGEDNIDISGTSEVSMRLYAPRAPVMISGDTHFTGGLVGATLQLSGNAEMEVTEDALHIWNPC